MTQNHDLEHKMDWGHILFGFKGRIGRKAYWGGTILVGLLGIAFTCTLSYLSTGAIFWDAILLNDPEHVNNRLLISVANALFIIWPLSALTIKRLHDRNRPAWIWFVIFTVSCSTFFLPMPQPGQLPPPPFLVIMFMNSIAGAYATVEIGILRGTPGLNRYGADPLPPDYHGGNYDLWSLYFAPEGRISRSVWWKAFLVTCGLGAVCLGWIAYVMSQAVQNHPELAANINDPDLLNTAHPVFSSRVFDLVLIPCMLLPLIGWFLFALAIKRLHDRGLSGWLLLLVVLPVLAVKPAIAASASDRISIAVLLFLASIIWCFLQLGILKGEAGPNKHGPDTFL